MVLLLVICFSDGALHLIIEYAVYGNLKDFLLDYQTVTCSQFSSSKIKPQESLITLPSPSSPTSISTATFSLAYSALQEKFPFSRKSSVISSASGRRAESELSATTLHKSCESVTEAGACSTPESGFSEEESIKSVVSTTYQPAPCSGHHCGSCGSEKEKIILHEMETIQFQDFCLQIAQGLQHLESLNVSINKILTL